jgi:hypothetical protein
VVRWGTGCCATGKPNATASDTAIVQSLNMSPPIMRKKGGCNSYAPSQMRLPAGGRADGPRGRYETDSSDSILCAQDADRDVRAGQDDKTAERRLSRIAAAEQDAGLHGGPSMYRRARSPPGVDPAASQLLIARPERCGQANNIAASCP